jgi:chromosome segregation ATPase
VALLLVTVSLHTSASRWHSLTLELEEREDMHRTELATMQLKFKTKCGSVDKQIAALEKERDLARIKLREKTQELAAKKADTAQLTRAAKEATSRRAGVEAELADALETNKEKEAAVASAGDELEEMKQTSFEALKSCRVRTGVLKRGLQGSSAVLAERAVSMHLMNVTLLAVLSHQSPEARKEAMQHVVQLGMAPGDKQVLNPEP